ncbi:MAG TPA: DUF4129 domain-containing protein, partial [Acidimicrobiales bacterium]|nr:DUF4129 domain-containing protein [Acidimicrobiales bacterium]
NPNPGSIIATDVGHLLDRLPLVPLGGGLAAAAALLLGWRAFLRRPRSWAEGVARRIERAGSAEGLRRQPSETLAEYGGRLGAAPAPSPGPFGARGGRAERAESLAGSIAVLERAAYGGGDPDQATRRAVERAARRLGGPPVLRWVRGWRLSGSARRAARARGRRGSRRARSSGRGRRPAAR